MNASRAKAVPVSDEMKDAVKRVSEAVGVISGGDAAVNEAPPYFFDALQRQRYGIDHCGQNWERALPAGQSAVLARVHRKASAVDALAGLLMADFEAQQPGADEPQFSPAMREGLFLALTELASDVHGAISGIGMDMHLKDLRGGGA